MSDIVIRRAEEKDLQKVDELLFQVNKVHSDARPDLFKPGAKNTPTPNLKRFFKTIKPRFLSPV